MHDFGVRSSDGGVDQHEGEYYRVQKRPLRDWADAPYTPAEIALLRDLESNAHDLTAQFGLTLLNRRQLVPGIALIMADVHDLVG